MPDNFTILGGGIGGLTLALALQRKGFTVNVYEAAEEIRPLGAGLGLAANAIRAFESIGIAEKVVKAGKILKTLRLRDTKGNILSESDSEKITARLGVVNNFAIHRADLHRVLIDALAPGTLVLGKRCTGFTKDGTKIGLQFSDGSNLQTTNLIACDGIHSIVRRSLLPNIPIRYAGYTCWRGITDTLPAGIDPDETSETWGRGKRFGMVPIPGNRLYWFAVTNAPQNDPRLKNWKTRELLTHFSDFHCNVREVIRSTDDDKVIWNDIIDIPPISRFAFDNVVLMGDAAHATTPNLGQGACMAIEDAAVLAQCVQLNAANIADAFREFERKRIARTTSVVRDSWRMGQVAQWQNPFLVALRNNLLRLVPASAAERRVKALISEQ